MTQPKHYTALPPVHLRSTGTGKVIEIRGTANAHVAARAAVTVVPAETQAELRERLRDENWPAW